MKADRHPPLARLSVLDYESAVTADRAEANAFENHAVRNGAALRNTKQCCHSERRLTSRFQGEFELPASEQERGSCEVS